MRGLWILTALVALASCKRNLSFCDGDGQCGVGLRCVLPAHECQPGSIIPSVDMALPDLTSSCAACSGSTPICVAPTCMSCASQPDPEAACAAVSPSTPHCVVSGQPAGSCVGCRDAGDCSDPAAALCDPSTHSCRPCTADSDCASQICELTPGSTSHGRCVDAGKIVYVDLNAPTGGNGLTPATALQKIMDGVNKAVGLTPARPYVHVAAGSYNESVGVNNKTISLVGATGVIVHPMNGDALGAQGGGALTVRNLVATAQSGNGGNCQSGASFAAYHTQFLDNAQIGVYATGCQLLLDGCWVHGNTTGGISVSGSFTILDSIITKNNGGGVNQIATGTATVFVNNTVADNVNGTVNAGASCPLGGGFMPINTIFYNNKGAGGAISETNCSGSFDASDDPSAGPQSTVDLTATPPGFKSTVPLSPDSYHLLPTSKCINEGTSTGAPDHDYDFEPRPDPKSMKVDIGADELQ